MGRGGGPQRAAESNEARWSTTQDNWCSPPEAIHAVNQFWGDRDPTPTQPRPIDLDPCSNKNSIVDATIEWFGPHVGGTDGLIMPWNVFGAGTRVYANFPFSDKASWITKAEAEFLQRRVQIITLSPADTDTNWFQTYGVRATGRCFWKGRMTFGGDRDMPARFPTLLCYWGPALRRWQDYFSQHGWCP